MNKLLIPARAWVSSPTAVFIDTRVCSLAQCPESEGPVYVQGLVAPAHLGGGRAYLQPLSKCTTASVFPLVLVGAKEGGRGCIWENCHEQGGTQTPPLAGGCPEARCHPRNEVGGRSVGLFGVLSPG